MIGAGDGPEPGPAEQERRAWATRLLAACPEVRAEVSDLKGTYVVAGAITLRARERIRSGASAGDPRVVALFAALEEAARGSANLQELAAWGVNGSAARRPRGQAHRGRAPGTSGPAALG